MELSEFLRQTQSEVRAEIGERMDSTESPYPYPELVFSEIVMQHMADVGMTFDDPTTCHFERSIGNSNLRLSGYAISEEADQLDLFVSLYAGVTEITPITDSEVKQAAERCLGLLTRCVDGRLLKNLDDSEDIYPFALTVQECYGNLDQIRIYVLTDRQAKAKGFKPQDVSGKTIKLEVMDIERLYRHWSEGKPRDELTLNFVDVCGGALPCVYVHGEKLDYDYALTALPAEALRFAYEKYGARLLEANVRSFLNVTGKVNRGIRDTLKNDPERFMAFNNGIVIVADEAEIGRAADGSPGILWLKGMQIVNGGQTTASIYFTQKKSPDIDLNFVRVAAKILVLRALNPSDEEALISDISRYANSQNAVRLSDLSANKPFQIELERLSTTVYCPDGVGRWFYERAAGSYHVMLTREGTTPARLRALKSAIPASRKITKTDLAKYLNAWDQKPHLVSLGAQKNFEKFMEEIAGSENAIQRPLPDASAYKLIIAKAILFKKVNSLIRPLFKAFQANVAAYLVAILANRVGSKLSLERIWEKQDISHELSAQLRIWAVEVSDAMHVSSAGRMVSEWSKKRECWDAVSSKNYSPCAGAIPELIL